MKSISAYILIGFAVLVFSPGAGAAPYGGQDFGACKYNESCAAAAEENPERVNTDPGTPVPNQSQNPKVVESDVDNDGNLEQATDTDGDGSNGYEEFNDNDGSSKVVTAVIDDNDGGTSFFIDTNGDDEPDIYWDPDDEYVAEVTTENFEDETCWYYRNSDDEQRAECYLVDNQEEEDPIAPISSGNNSGGSVESARRLTSGGFGGEVYEQIGEFVQRIPAPVAYSLPYVLISVIGVLVVRLIMQTKKELGRVSVVANKIRQEKLLLEEKQNFLMLGSHYMRTPVTVIKGNIELAQSLKTIDETTSAKLSSIANNIEVKINALLEGLTNNQKLGSISPPMRVSQARLKVLLSLPVLLPILGIILISVFMQFIFIDFRVTRPSFFDILVQSALGLLVIQTFVSKYRSYKVNLDNRRDQQEVLEKQRDLDESRSAFVHEASNTLAGDVNALDAELQQQASQGKDTSKIRKGTDQLKNVVNKFIFAGSLQAGQIQAEKEQFSSSEVISQVLASQEQKASSKNIKLSTAGEEARPYQNRRLFSIVLSSLVDNAIKYAKDGSTVSVNTLAAPDTFTFGVDNQGTPIANEKISTLFKPFSRVESAETFDQEGLGFSLYLDRLIMMYMGGSINMQPIEGVGTHAEVKIPALA